jgi:hypothetical protein
MRGIEELYTSINDWFLILEGHLEDKTIGGIFRMCRIKPYDISKEHTQSKFRNHWIDEFGNSVYIENKEFRIVLNDLAIDENRKRSSDLYSGLLIGKIVKISKMALVSKDCLIGSMYIALLGIDGYLRVFCLIDGEWRKCSPLLLGIDKVRLILECADISHSQEKDGDWLSILPMSKELVRKLDLEGVMNG